MTIVRLTAPVTLKASAGSGDGPVPVDIVAYNGGMMHVPGIGKVVINIEGLEIPETITLLADHDSSRAGVVGSGQVLSASSNIVVTGSISRQSEAGQNIIALHKDGVRWQASVGVDMHSRQRIQAGQSITVNGQNIVSPPGGMTYVASGVLKELTICALGCDPTTSVTIAAQDTGHKAMTFTQWLEERGFNQTDLDETQVASLRAMYVAERRQETNDGQRQHLLDTIDRLSAQYNCGEDTLQGLRLQAQAGGIDESDIELEMIRKSRARGVADFQPWRPHRNEGRLTQDVICCALALKAGREDVAETYGEQTMLRASDMRRKSLFDMQNALLTANGQPGFDDVDDMLRASAGGSSTLSLPTTLGNTANRFVEVEMRETPSTWNSFASIRTADNFHWHSAIRPSFVGDLEELGPDGEVKHGSMDEFVIQWRVDQFAKMFSVSRPTLINDGVGFFDEVLPQMARAARRKLNDLVWTAILANAGNHFHADNGNYLTGGGSALSLTSLETAVKQMRKQRDDQGNDLDVKPMVLAVPPDLEVTAKGILNSLELLPDSSGPTGNPMKSIVTLEVEPRISNTARFANASATRWYLFAGPREVPVVVAFGPTGRAPRVEFFGLDHDVKKLAYSWRCYQDFSAGLGDPVAGQMSDGA